MPHRVTLGTLPSKSARPCATPQLVEDEDAFDPLRAQHIESPVSTCGQTAEPGLYW